MPINFGYSDLDYDKQEKLPTLKQYLKTLGKGKLPGHFVVTKIWIPNKFPAYSIETEKFRINVNRGTEMYEVLKAHLEHLTSGQILPAIQVATARDGSFNLIGLEEEKPTIKELGEYGYAFE